MSGLRREGPINRFNADVLIPELRESGRQFDVQTYPGQAHGFCSASGLPRPRGMAAPASWPAAALKAFQDNDAAVAVTDRERLGDVSQFGNHDLANRSASI